MTVRIDGTSGGGSTAGLAFWTPFLLLAGESFTVPANKQALFTIPVELDAATAIMTVDGVLAEVV